MANNGYITSSGIIQIFTTGPYSGSEVTSSYSDGSTLFGGAVNTFQPFISGDLDIIIPCESNPIIPGVNYFERFNYNPTVCPPDDICLSPILISAQRNTCNDLDLPIYNLNWSSGSSIADYTIVEYSTSNTFNITGSTILDNSNFTSSVNVLINGFAPQSTTPIYFRAYNSCSNNSTSFYSQTVIANNCEVITPTYPDFTFNIVNQTNLTVQTTNGSGNGVNGPWFNVPTNNTTGNSYSFNTNFGNFFFKVQSPQNCPNQGVYIELTTTSTSINGNVVTSINTTLDPNDCSGLGNGVLVSNYNATPYFLHYPTTNMNNQFSTNIFINRENWFNVGNIKLTIKYQSPGGPIIGL
jgi:hypothetical protein